MSSAALVVVLALLLVFSGFAWRQPVTSAPQNRNDAAFYLVLAGNLLDHGVYSHQQNAPFAPHTEWPPGIPLWYAIPLAVARVVPTFGLTFCVRLWTWGTALAACLVVYRYLCRFCPSGISAAIVAATAFSTAFLDEAQVALADIPALAALYGVLLGIEKFFTASRPSRIQHAGLLMCMSMLPLVKPYLGVVFVAYLWKAAGECLAVSASAGGAGYDRVRRSARPALLHSSLMAVCCFPFVVFMVWSVQTAERAGTISAVTWLTTDNAVAQREGIDVADPKTAGEWMQNAADTVKYHLVYHMVSSPLPLLQTCGLRDWPAVPRWLVTVLLLGLQLTGMLRNLRGRGAAAVVFLAAMLAVFAVLACDSVRYFIILMPLCAWMILDGARTVVESVCGVFGPYLLKRGRGSTLSAQPVNTESGQGDVLLESRRRPSVARLIFIEWRAAPLLMLLAVCAGATWAVQRRSDGRDADPLFDAVYRELAGVQRRAGREPLCVPYPLREIAILETGRRVMTHDEWLALRESEQLRCVVLVTSPDIRHNTALRTSQDVMHRLAALGFVVDARDLTQRLISESSATLFLDRH